MDDKIDDGGPAFPTENSAAHHPGMSLRDWFAGQALAGLLSDASLNNCVDFEGIDDYASAAFDAADAMLEARKKGGA